MLAGCNPDWQGSAPPQPTDPFSAAFPPLAVPGLQRVGAKRLLGAWAPTGALWYPQGMAGFGALVLGLLLGCTGHL